MGVTARQPDVELHIEALALYGLEHLDHDQVGAAVQQELARLLAEGGVPPALLRSRDLGRVDGGAFDVAPGSTGGEIGAQVAQAVYGSMQP